MNHAGGGEVANEEFSHLVGLIDAVNVNASVFLVVVVVVENWEHLYIEHRRRSLYDVH